MTLPPQASEQEISAEVADQTESEQNTLEGLAAGLAQTNAPLVRAGGEPLPLLAHADRLKERLQQAYLFFAQATEAAHVISYGGEWLLDNHYIIQQAVQQITKNMPPQFYRQLPKVCGGHFAGYPHIYVLAHALSRFLRGLVSMEEQRRFIAAYQAHVALSIGELWAWPVMLQIAVLENLVIAFDQIIEAPAGNQPALVPQIVREQYPLEVDADLVVANSVMTLRAISAQDWQVFFEEASRVEAILRLDPSGIYERMDFETRNRYREQIEKLAARSPEHTEEQVAFAVLQLARRSAEQGTQTEHGDLPSQDREAHVGYYLIDRGLAATRQTLGYPLTVGERLAEALKSRRSLLYLGSIWILAALVLLAAGRYAAASGAAPMQRAVVVVLMIVPALTITSHLVNWLALRLVSPRILPKMDFSAGIPPEHRSIVVIPALLTDLEEARALAKQLEQHYLRNTDANLRFAILADFVDGSAEYQPEDATLVESAKAQVNALNARYGDDDRRPFYFFLRKRLWNAAEGRWMGYERKRGKLAEFNRLLLDPNASTSYVVKEGDLAALRGTRYVITLDADTVLPRESAHRLIGTFAHPLNQPRFRDGGRELIAGYTILQPRIEILPTAANRTPFTYILSGESGLDLYTLAVSDVYQDVFNQGIYVGKGIYDVAAFERSLTGRAPENALLSHDLFEGLHGGVGLVTDVVMLEDYPSHYFAHMSRLHRWVRGDWQLLPWLLPKVPSESGERLPNCFSPLDRWKIVDNLIRSLLHPALFAMLLLSWLWLPGSAVVWSVFALLVLLIPFVIGMFNQVLTVSLTGKPMQRRGLMIALLRWTLATALLPYEALVRADAIAVTLRRLRQQKRLLEWTTSAAVVRQVHGQASGMARKMYGVVALAAAVALVSALTHPHSLFASLPLVAAWIYGPLLAERISQPRERAAEPVTAEQRRRLRTLSRRTWLYFEEFVGPEGHWLPPDHYQETPITKVGHYTSPTNIGLMLLSVLAAYDRGYIGLLELMTRLQLAFESISQLEHYRGHLLNWYSTRTLQPLSPRYVSTVDNGNFAACLLTLERACHQLPEMPLLRQQRWQGILDTLDILAETLDSIEQQQANPRISEAHQQLATMREHVLAAQHRPADWSARLAQIRGDDWQALSAALLALVENTGHVDARLFHALRIYLSRLQHHLSSFRRDLEMLAPWIAAFPQAPVYLREAQGQIAASWQALLDSAPESPPAGDLYAIYRRIGQRLTALCRLLEARTEAGAGAAHAWCVGLQEALNAAEKAAASLLEQFATVRQQVASEFRAMDFRFLYSAQRHLFHIGYNVDLERLDNSYYDLFASEARLASFIAIARHDVSQQHWLHLSRPVTMIDNIQTLLSWSGTMFEYFMPLIFMRSYPNTLLHQSYQAVVQHQISYARQHQVPWGMSESGYYAFDSMQNYQYRAFGLPALGFKRGQERDLVIAPYAALLALPTAPRAVLENIEALIDAGALTTYGFVEAIDYTISRLPLGRDHALVREYMSHHQGMIFLATANFLQDNLMVGRFHSSPLVESVELLLMEQIPEQATFEQQLPGEIKEHLPVNMVATHPWEVPVHSPAPQAHYLSNGRYSVMITHSGSGYSQWKTRAVTRWQADPTLDNWGQWLYLFDEDSGALWSPTPQPLGSAEQTSAIFHLSRVEFQSRAHDITARLEVLVPPEDDLEIRRLTLTNHSEEDRRLTLCSYGEMVLAPQAADQRHPAFNKMFVESERLPQSGALLFRRRLRSAHDEPMFVLHMLVTPEGAPEAAAYETDRRRFIGRNRTSRNPLAFDSARPQLSGTTGATLDPIMAIAHSVMIPAHSTVEVAYLTIAAAARDEALTLAQRYRAWEELERGLNQARYRSERELRHLSLNTDDIARFQRLLSSLLYPNPRFRAEPDVLAANTRAQPGLWAYGISGDFPIVLAQISSEEQLDLVHDLVMAHRYWRHRGFPSTLVILNQSDTGYMQLLYNQIHRLLVRTGNEIWLNRHDGIFVLRAEQMNDAERVLLQTAARVRFDGQKGSLQTQLNLPPAERVLPPPLMTSLAPGEIEDQAAPLERPADLRFDNGYGGFTADGREYVIYLDRQRPTPAPWVNVIANASGGFIVSEAGGGFTWAGNSGEYRLSTWRNDPVTDMPGEALYLRDEETGAVWTATPLPAGADAPYLVRHGAGYSTFEHQSHGLRQSVHFSIAPEDAVKLVRIRLRNTTTRPRRVTLTYYVEWVLGPLREITQQYVIPEYAAEEQTLLAHNPYSMEFGGHYAFVAADQPLHGMTADRSEFLGPRGSLHTPEALRRVGLNGSVRAGEDPCAALQVHVDLPLDGEAEVCFVIGAAPSRAAALDLSRRYRAEGAIARACEETRAFWRSTLDSIIVRTPDEAMNLLLPWLLYQALSCRIWGRSALYQSSGAFGFRDQLQDVMALVHVRPDLTREHILRAARHQFQEGDVLHWWHPPSGRGVRTRFADDLVWLPYVVSHYIRATGDDAVLQAEEPFLQGEPLRPEEEERYGFYEATEETYSLYEHCRRALNKAYALGRHNLPLMKAGDWNDGMNRVGIGGEGESVWMAWFLHVALAGFVPLCEQMDDELQAETYRRWMGELQTAVETSAWDGQWYRRAYYDDGTPLGSAQNRECRIDSLTQSWAVLSGAAQPERATEAMQAALEHLVRRDERLIRLFTPPFDQTERDPGYIKGYPPGIRENGGQYTHAALWVVWAFAELAESDLADSLFRLLNPVTHSATKDEADLYRVEPYVVAADVYSAAPHTGLGGWTWYTGSSGWMYRLGIEALLGLHREGEALRIAPRANSRWRSYEVEYRYGESVYHITVQNPDQVQAGVRQVLLDQQALPDNRVPLRNDGRRHEVLVIRGVPRDGAERDRR